jgi:hypothetical protein
MWEPSRRIPVWLRLPAAATAKTAFTPITGATAGTAPFTRPAPGAGAGWSRSGFDAHGKRLRGRSAARPRPRSRTSSRRCTRSWTLGCGPLRGIRSRRCEGSGRSGHCRARDRGQIVAQLRFKPGALEEEGRDACYLDLTARPAQRPDRLPTPPSSRRQPA